MTAPSLSLAAPEGHPLAQAVAISLAVRGTSLERVPLRQPVDLADDTALRLTCRRAAQPQVVLRDPLAMLDLTEDLHPDQPLHPRDPVRRAEHREGLALVRTVFPVLDQVCNAKAPRELDLAIHLLRSRLTRIETLLASAQATSGSGFSLLDTLLAPLLWRLKALDEVFDSFLLIGFGRLDARAGWLLARPEVRGELPAARRLDLPRQAWERGALVARRDEQPDWSAALGPEAAEPVPVPENNLLWRTLNTKVRSIGDGGALR